MRYPSAGHSRQKGVAIFRRPTGSSYNGSCDQCQCSCGNKKTKKETVNQGLPKIVQYCEESVIKTFDWLNIDSEETAL